MSMGASGTLPFSILAVCTGNVCRSPIVEQLLRARLESAAGVVAVSSAGTNANIGQPMTAEAASLSLEYGGAPTGHAARRLSADLVANASLVLTATREHRAEVVSLHPRASRYAFTVKQFARLLKTARELEPEKFLSGSGDSTDFLQSVLAVVATNRGYAPPLLDPEDDDIQDPYLQPQFVYDNVGGEIDTAVTEIIDAFSGRSGDPFAKSTTA